MIYSYSFGDFYVRHAIDEEPCDRDFTMHIHQVCEIYFFVSGDVKYLVEGSEYMLDNNSLLILRPSEVHKPKILTGERYERFTVNFPIDFARSIDPDGRLTEMFVDKTLGKNNLFRSSEVDMKLIKSLFCEMCKEREEAQMQLAIKTHLVYMLDILMRAYSKRENTENDLESLGERMVTYVNTHLLDDISVPRLAKHFYLSSSQFSRVFKLATGASPWVYVTKKRLSVAREKIRAGATAQSAAEECGFRDYSSFYRAYTKHFGIAPTLDA